jgi:hypothetical protein
MKEKVSEWLKSGCSWNDGLALMPDKGHLVHFKLVCRRQGPLKSNRRMMEYQLCRMAGINAKEAEKLKLQYKAESKTAVHISTEAIHVSTEAVHIDAVVTRRNNDRKRLRDQFPFLSDPNCPNVFKILANDKMTAYYNYLDSHPKLRTSQSEGELLQNCKDVVENWLNNRLIFEEFEYYQKRKKVLGKHPIFKAMKREEKILEMKVPELIKLLDKLNMNIWRNKKLIKDEPGSDLMSERIERVKNYEFELKIVLRLLDAK